MKKLILIALVGLMGHTAFAQAEKRMDRDEKRKEIEAQRVAYITTQLDLTTEESQAFWPVYNDYEKALDEHRKAGKENFNPRKDDITTLSDSEIDTMMKNKFEHQREKIEIEETYFEKFKGVLSMQKVAAFYKADQDFRKELLKKLKQDRRNDQGMNRRGSERTGFQSKEDKLSK